MSMLIKAHHHHHRRLNGIQRENNNTQQMLVISTDHLEYVGCISALPAFKHQYRTQGEKQYISIKYSITRADPLVV